MTTEAAARMYEAEHVLKWNGVPFAFFNPKAIPFYNLPVIYGFSNGRQPGLLLAVLIAEDGPCLGSHACSSESYMPSDLGLLKGSRPDRHKTFKEHYPDGYRMEFVGYDSIEEHEKLQAAFKLNKSSKEDSND